MDTVLPETMETEVSTIITDLKNLLNIFWRVQRFKYVFHQFLNVIVIAIIIYIVSIYKH